MESGGLRHPRSDPAIFKSGGTCWRSFRQRMQRSIVGDLAVDLAADLVADLAGGSGGLRKSARRSAVDLLRPACLKAVDLVARSRRRTWQPISSSTWQPVSRSLAGLTCLVEWGTHRPESVPSHGVRDLYERVVEIPCPSCAGTSMARASSHAAGPLRELKALIPENWVV
jgi:hypothetical protein